MGLRQRLILSNFTGSLSAERVTESRKRKGPLGPMHVKVKREMDATGTMGLSPEQTNLIPTLPFMDSGPNTELF